MGVFDSRLPLGGLLDYASGIVRACYKPCFPDGRFWSEPTHGLHHLDDATPSVSPLLSIETVAQSKALRITHPAAASHESAHPPAYSTQASATP